MNDSYCPPIVGFFNHKAIYIADLTVALFRCSGSLGDTIEFGTWLNE